MVMYVGVRVSVFLCLYDVPIQFWNCSDNVVLMLYRRKSFSAYLFK